DRPVAVRRPPDHRRSRLVAARLDAEHGPGTGIARTHCSSADQRLRLSIKAAGLVTPEDGMAQTDRHRIGTRGSRLALWQAHAVRDALAAAHALPHDAFEIVPFTT